MIDEIDEDNIRLAIEKLKSRGYNLKAFFIDGKMRFRINDDSTEIDPANAEEICDLAKEIYSLRELKELHEKRRAEEGGR